MYRHEGGRYGESMPRYKRTKAIKMYFMIGGYGSIAACLGARSLGCGQNPIFRWWNRPIPESLRNPAFPKSSDADGKPRAFGDAINFG